MTEPAPPGPSEEVVRARAVRDAAATALAAATEAQGRAAAAVAAWAKEHPGAEEAAKAVPLLEQTGAELERLLADRSLVADPANAKPAELRLVRAAMVKHVEASPERVALVERVLAAMREDLGGREVAGVSEWREIPFTSEGFRRAAARLLAAAQATAVPTDLLATHVAATKDVEASRTALDAAEAALKAAEAAGK
jgi:hypothetical protein